MASVMDNNAANDSATDTDTLIAEADVGVTKDDGVTSAVPGQSVIYTIVASNTGPSDDPAVSLTDTLPASLNCSWNSTASGGATGNSATLNGDLSEALNLPAGSSVTYTGNCGITAGATGNLVNTVSISGSVTDNNAVNDSATDTDALMPRADLLLMVSDDQDPVPSLTPFHYLFSIENLGASDAQDLQLTLNLPVQAVYQGFAGTGWSCSAAVSQVLCSKANLPVGATDSLGVQVSAVDGANRDAPYRLAVDAVLQAQTVDPNPANNQVNEHTLIGVSDNSCSGVQAIVTAGRQIVVPTVCEGSVSAQIQSNVDVYDAGDLYIRAPYTGVQAPFHVQQGSVLSISAP
jgi:uncharacterized repeat protein (TIGR01451 family)